MPLKKQWIFFSFFKSLIKIIAKRFPLAKYVFLINAKVIPFQELLSLFFAFFSTINREHQKLSKISDLKNSFNSHDLFSYIIISNETCIKIYQRTQTLCRGIWLSHAQAVCGRIVQSRCQDHRTHLRWWLGRHYYHPFHWWSLSLKNHFWWKGIC